MPFCKKCGVEVEERHETCPLCGEKINGKIGEEDLENRKYPRQEPTEGKKFKKLSPEIQRKIIWEIVSIALTVPLILILIINFILSRTVDWGLYPITTIVYIWLAISFPLRFLKKPLLIVGVEIISLVGFLAIIDLIDGTFSWFQYLALPITFTIIIITGIVVLLSFKSKRKGANIAAFILFGVSLLCIGLDLIIINYVKEVVILIPTWSIFVSLALIPIGLFLLYIHYRLSEVVDIKRKVQL